MSIPPIVVQKFGGTSVSTPERREMVVGHVARERAAGRAVAIVVSAMGRRGDPYATDTLLDLLRSDGGPLLPADYTLMFVTGEIISAAVMSHTLNRAGIPARGLTGAQARVYTDGHPTEAEVVDVDVSRLQALIAQGCVPVVTGGQGIVRETFDFNTLGRGASDTSGVVVGVALGAERVDIFTDVKGVASADPRVVPSARTIERISFDRMHELARFGAKVVHPRAVKAGWRGRTPVMVRSTFSGEPGTWIGEVQDEPPFSGIASLDLLHTLTVPSGSIDETRLGTWERTRLIMHLGEATDLLILGAPDITTLRDSLAEARVRPVEDLGPQAWVSVVGDSHSVRAGAAADRSALDSAGVRTVFQAAGHLRSTFVVDQAQLAVQVLHEHWSRT